MTITPRSCDSAPSLGLPPLWWWLDEPVDAPERPALLSPDGQVLSRRELSRALRATACHLLAQGIGRNDRLALVMSPGTRLAASLLAGMAVAAVAPLVPTSPLESVLEDLQRLRATWILVDEQPPAAVLEAAARMGLPVLTLEPFQEPQAEAGGLPAPGAEDLALLLQTSGTTSRPKVVPLSHANLHTSALSVADALGLGPWDRSLAAMPLFHIHGIVASLLAPLLAGGSVICCRSSAPGEILPLLVDLQPTWLSAVPTILQGLLASLDRAELDRAGWDRAGWDRSVAKAPSHTLRLLRSSSSPLPPAVLERLEAVFQVPVLEAYGMTEAAHQICSNRPPGTGLGRQAGSVGGAAGPEVAILGPGLALQPCHQTGEVAIRGANVTAGYEAAGLSGWITAADGQRWFLTGDEGRLDIEGRLILSGRLKEMINRGGEKVVPRRVDEALLRHPAVEQAVAFAVPHPTLGEDLAAAVVLRGAERADEQELRQHAFSLLAPHEVPSRVLRLSELPRGATGKLQRIGLAEKLAAQLRPSEEPASGPWEERIATIVAEVLQQKPPGREANFFQLGCDSLSGLEVISRLAAERHQDIHPALLFAYPTVRSLAEHLELSADRPLEPAGEVAE